MVNVEMSEQGYTSLMGQITGAITFQLQMKLLQSFQEMVQRTLLMYGTSFLGFKGVALLALVI